MCQRCRNNKSVIRNFLEDQPLTNIKRGSDKITLGEQAQRNTELLSDDEKASIYNRHNSYKDKRFAGKLPAKAKLYDKLDMKQPKPTNKVRRKVRKKGKK